MKLEQHDDAGVQGAESAKTLAVTGGGYKRRLQTAVTNGSCVVSETEMKPKRNRNEDAAAGLGCEQKSLAQLCPAEYWKLSVISLLFSPPIKNRDIVATDILKPHHLSSDVLKRYPYPHNYTLRENVPDLNYQSHHLQ